MSNNIEFWMARRDSLEFQLIHTSDYFHSEQLKIMHEVAEQEIRQVLEV